MDARQAVGRYGEQVAAGYLTEQGLEVVARNWRCHLPELRGELDIVALDRAAEAVVFVEVKTRRSLTSGHPAEAVTYRKVRQLRRLAALWCQEHQPQARHMRIDVVCVTVPGRGKAQVLHLPAVA